MGRGGEEERGRREGKEDEENKKEFGISKSGFWFLGGGQWWRGGVEGTEEGRGKKKGRGPKMIAYYTR